MSCRSWAVKGLRRRGNGFGRGDVSPFKVVFGKSGPGSTGALFLGDPRGSVGVCLDGNARKGLF